jgi:hypothetical protein
VSSIWNRIGDAASNLVKFGGEVGKSIGGVARFAWDVGTAPFNDAEEYNGLSQTFKTAAEKQKATGDIIRPLASAAGAVMKVPYVAPALEKIYEINREYIREPLTTTALVSGEVFSGRTSPLGFFDPDQWRKAYKGAQDISFGQATVGAYRTIYDPKFNVYDPRQREAAFKNSFWGKTTTGLVDVFGQFFGDVTVAGTKALQVAKASGLGVGKLGNADAVAKAAEEITKAQYGVGNRFTKVLDDFTKNDSVYALNHPMVKASNNPGLLAHFLGDSVDVDETALILRSALGDPKAMDELALQRTYITDALKTARGDMDAVDQWKLFAAPDGSGQIPFLTESPAVMEEAVANYRSLAASDKYFSDLMELGKGGGALTRTTGLGLQGAEDFIAKARAARFYDKNVGSARIDVYQPTPFHRLYQKISWLENERPAGIVDFNDADSYREVVATLNRADKLRVLGADESKALLDNYIGASTPEARATATLALEGTIFRKLTEKYNISEEVANTIYNDYKRARTSALKSIQDKGFMVDLDGSILKVPLLESQSANYLPVMDFDLMDKALRRNANTLSAVVGRFSDRVFNTADLLQDAFKAGALLRLGYTQRNGIDSQLRIAASVGAMASLQHLGPGLKNLIYNTVKTPARIFDRYRRIDGNRTYGDVQTSLGSVAKELEELRGKIRILEGKVALRKDDLPLAGELNTLKLLEEEKLAVYQHYNDVLGRAAALEPKRRIGTGSFRVTTSDGQEYILDDAFGGELGEMFRKIASSGNTFERMVDSNTDLFMRTMSSKGIGVVRPTDPAYFEQWAQTLRQQFGNSRVAQKLADGETIDDIAAWLRNSPDGRDLRRRLALPADDSVDYVTRVSNFFDTYLPASSNLRDKLRTITADDLRSTFKDPKDLPLIHGHVLQENLYNGLGKTVNQLVNKAFKLLGTLPEDAWARNPLYIHFYRQEARRRLNIVAGTEKGARVSVKQQQEILSQAHKTALREMKGVLFNIERKTNFAMIMKYINPFFSAQENAYKTWMKLAVANPAIVNRGYLVWNAPNQAGLVTDGDGNEVPPGQTSGDDVIWLSVPKGLQNLRGLGQLTEMGIPKQSLDILFQGGLDVLYNKGNPNFFSDIFPVGPYVGVPASIIAKKQPTLEESLKFILPYGTYKDVLGIPSAGGIFPAWFQRLQTRAAGQNDPQFGRTYQLIWATEQQNAKREGRPPASDAQVEKMTRQYWSMRTFANLVMPFAPRFDSPYKFYLDKSREYRRLYGIEADAKFLNDFPEFFSFTTSLSNNPTGVQSSVAAVRNIQKYRDLVGEIAKIEPRLVGLLANDPSGYEFSQASYEYLYRERVSPGSPLKFLSAQSPADAQKRNDAEKGWIQYNKYIDIIDNELQKRGLSSVLQKGAEDLKYYKEQLIQKLAVQTNDDGSPVVDPKTGQFVQTPWYDDYLDSDGSKTNRVIYGLSRILEDEKFVKANENNSTWNSVGLYLDVRKRLARELSRRDVKSIDAKANADIRYYYDAVVAKLKNDDKMGFAYLYDRFLSQDLVFDKYLTPKVPPVQKETK